MVSVSQFLRIVEIRTKVISVSGFAVGATYTVYRYGPVDPVVFAITLAAVLAVDMATTGFNTFFDFYSGVDRRGVNRETDKVLVHQNVAAGPALLISLGLYAIAAGLGIVLAVIATPLVVPIGAISMLIGFLYNAGPLPLSRTPLGELFAGGFSRLGPGNTHDPHPRSRWTAGSGLSGGTSVDGARGIDSHRQQYLRYRR
jgi:1,4-dihydroxy-2-naphthoate octaprenyltransferase